MTNWSDSISSMIQKTDVNLKRIVRPQSPYSEEPTRPYTAMTSVHKFDFSQKKVENTELTQLQLQVAQNRA